MGKFTVIPSSTFDEVQTDAGILLRYFDPTDPEAADEDIICATTGGINPVCTPTFSDMGEDVDNAPNNTMELKHLDGWDCSISTTAIGTSPESIRFALGCADFGEGDETKIIPRADLKLSDFADIWWVGDRADGGFVAIQLKNALSTGGFSLQTTKNGKGQISLTITGHVSINDLKTVPMVFYSASGEDEESATTFVYTEVADPGTANPREEGWYVLVGDNYRRTTDTEVDENVIYYERETV